MAHGKPDEYLKVMWARTRLTLYGSLQLAKATSLWQPQLILEVLLSSAV